MSLAPMLVFYVKLPPFRRHQIYDVTWGGGGGRVDPHVRNWSLIMGRGGATKWENRGSETFCAPPPHDRVKLFKTFQRVETFHAPPLQYG